MRPSDVQPDPHRQIALGHMKEPPDYYERLERMEREAKRDWYERTC